MLGPEGVHQLVDQVEHGHPERDARLLLAAGAHEEGVEAVRLEGGPGEEGDKERKAEKEAAK